MSHALGYLGYAPSIEAYVFTAIRGDFLTWSLPDAMKAAGMWKSYPQVNAYFAQVNRDLQDIPSFEIGVPGIKDNYIANMFLEQDPYINRH